MPLSVPGRQNYCAFDGRRWTNAFKRVATNAPLHRHNTYCHHRFTRWNRSRISFIDFYFHSSKGSLLNVRPEEELCFRYNWFAMLDFILVFDRTLPIIQICVVNSFHIYCLYSQIHKIKIDYHNGNLNKLQWHFSCLTRYRPISLISLNVDFTSCLTRKGVVLLTVYLP